MSREGNYLSLEVPGEKEKMSPALVEHATTTNPYVCRTGRDKGSADELPEHYISRSSQRTANHDVDFNE